MGFLQRFFGIKREQERERQASSAATVGRDALSQHQQVAPVRWQASGTGEAFSLNEHSEGIRAITIGVWCALTSGYDNMLRLWDLGSGQQIRAIPVHFDLGGPPSGICLSGDGRLMACAADPIQVWATDTGAVIRRLPARGDSGHGGITLSHDGSHVVAGCDGNVARIWNVAEGRELASFHGHDRAVHSIALSRDGMHVLSGDEDHGGVYLWSADTGKEVARFSAPGGVTALSFSPDGRHALCAGYGKKAYLIDLQARAATELCSHGDHIHSVAYSADGTLLAIAGGGLGGHGSVDNSVRLWNVSERTELARFTGHAAPVLGLGFSPGNDRIISGSKDKTMRRWKVPG